MNERPFFIIYYSKIIQYCCCAPHSWKMKIAHHLWIKNCKKITRALRALVIFFAIFIHSWWAIFIFHSWGAQQHWRSSSMTDLNLLQRLLKILSRPLEYFEELLRNSRIFSRGLWSASAYWIYSVIKENRHYITARKMAGLNPFYGVVPAFKNRVPSGTSSWKRYDPVKGGFNPIFWVHVRNFNARTLVSALK